MTILTTGEEDDLETEVNPTCLPRYQLRGIGKYLYSPTCYKKGILSKCFRFTTTVQDEFTRRLEQLSELQHQLKELPLRQYKQHVYGQYLYRQQGLILNFNILRTFCNNVMKYFELEPCQCCVLLQQLLQEAVHPRAGRIQAAHWYIPERGEKTLQEFTRISIWPLHEPVVTSYGDRKKALLERWKDNGKPKSDTLTIYIPPTTKIGEVSFEESEVAKREHFKRVMKIIKNEKHCLRHDETNPSEESNWVYYIVVFDPTVSPEAADQGYIGMTTKPLKKRMKQHARGKAMIIHYNLALISQYAQQRGEDLTKYVAVFALGTTRDRTSCRDVEGKLIRDETLEGCSVTNMKYGMNSKQGAKKPS